MSLTYGAGPLSRTPASTNYEIDGPAHRIYFHPFGRRVRLELAGEVVVDTLDAQLLHETNILPRLYVPLADVRSDLLEPSDTTSHCPFKGDATYRTWCGPAAGAWPRTRFWLYEQPLEAAPWLAGYAGVYEERFDRLLDEDDEVVGGHLRDPFHRVDVRRTSRHLRVTGPDGSVLAESSRPLLVAETGIANRFYLPREDARGRPRAQRHADGLPVQGRGHVLARRRHQGRRLVLRPPARRGQRCPRPRQLRRRGHRGQRGALAELLPQELEDQRPQERGLLVVGGGAVAALDVLVVADVEAPLEHGRQPSCGRGRGGPGRPGSR